VIAHRPDLVGALVDRWGSPLHLVVPSVMRENVRAFQAALLEARVGGRIFYAHKANAAAALAEAAVVAGIGIDVASLGELASALLAGCASNRIEVTGPKGRALVQRAVAAGLTVNVDNFWELDEVVRAASVERPAGRPPVPVLVRLSGFTGVSRAGATHHSRFGIPVARAGDLLAALLRARDSVTFLGPSFHLDTDQVQAKAAAAQQCLAVIEQAWQAGLAPTVLNVGGGFRQAFVDDTTGFDAYVETLKLGLLRRHESLTWNEATLGYRVDSDRVQGIGEFQKYAGTVTGPQSLHELLQTPLPDHDGLPLARVLGDAMIELWIEPGKAMVDHAGLTIATVQFVTSAADGSPLVTLDLSRDKVCPADQEVMLDPIVLRGRSSSDIRDPADPVGVFFAGALCLERDLVLRHRVYLDRLPEAGDYVVFVNTAAYQMDLSASDALMHPRPRRLVVDVDPGPTLRARPDTAGAELSYDSEPDRTADRRGEELTWPLSTR
jgi:diaminopimelate decarboxylase